MEKGNLNARIEEARIFIMLAPPQGDGFTILPQDTFIDLLNGGAIGLFCQPAVINNKKVYEYKAIYEDLPIKTITETKIYEV